MIKFAKQIGGAAENWSQIEVQREHIFNDQTKQMFYRSKGLKEKEGHLKDLLNGTPRRAQFCRAIRRNYSAQFWLTRGASLCLSLIHI